MSQLNKNKTKLTSTGPEDAKAEELAGRRDFKDHGVLAGRKSDEELICTVRTKERA